LLFLLSPHIRSPLEGAETACLSPGFIVPSNIHPDAEAAMEEKDRQIAEELKKRLPPDVKQRIRKLIVFGSRATGRATEESDLDIIVLVDVKTPDIENMLDEVAYGVMWDRDFKPIISLKVMAESQFRGALTKGYSFYKHVEREGVAV
jgi:predicted nucleotidyltransferase